MIETTETARTTGARERPILFAGPMVMALLEGRKTQTRRLMKRNQPVQSGPIWDWFPGGKTAGFHAASGEPCFDVPSGWAATWCPHGKPRDHLWVRETWGLIRLWPEYDEGYPCGGCDIEDWAGPIPKACPPGWSIVYRANNHWEEHADDRGFRWRPSIHMPRWASRITLEVTEIRVQRLHSISEDDAFAEGVGPGYVPNSLGSTSCVGYRPMFARVWNEINGKGSWDLNSWVWAISFRRVESQ